MLGSDKATQKNTAEREDRKGRGVGLEGLMQKVMFEQKLEGSKGCPVEEGSRQRGEQVQRPWCRSLFRRCEEGIVAGGNREKVELEKHSGKRLGQDLWALEVISRTLS